jgi:hypothetical protein
MPSYSSYKPTVGVKSLTAGTGTHVSTSTGDVEVWVTLAGFDPSGTTTTYTISNLTQSTATSNGALVVFGGAGIGGNLNVGNTSTFYGPVNIYNNTYITGTVTITNTLTVVGPAFVNGGLVVTTATIGQFGLSTFLFAGTDTVVNTATGVIFIWNTSTLQSVTNRGTSTNRALSFTNATDSTSTQSGAIVISGGLGVGKSVNASLIYENGFRVLTSATMPSANISNGNDIFIQVTTTTSIINNISTFDSVTGRGSTTTSKTTFANTSSSTGTDTGAVVILGGLGVGENLNVGNDAVISNMLTVGHVKTQLLVKSNVFDYNSSSTVSVSSQDSVGYSGINLQNLSGTGQSYTWEVGGTNRGGSGSGLLLNETNLALSDDKVGVYRLVLVKGTGNVIIGDTNYSDTTSSIDKGYKLQVLGAVSANTASINTFESTSTIQFVSPVEFNSTATFQTPINYQQTTLDTVITNVTNTDTVLVASFSTQKHRSCRSIVQIEDPGVNYQLTEVVMLIDDVGNVYKSEYGIINTGLQPSGSFTADYFNSLVRLFFTADSSSNKSVTVTKTSVPRNDFTGIS